MNNIKLIGVGFAKKSKDGFIQYCVWVDAKESLYVQMINNSKSGSLSDKLFSVSDYASKRHDKKLANLKAYNLEQCNRKSNELVNVHNNNNSAFLQAVLKDLLPDES